MNQPTRHQTTRFVRCGLALLGASLVLANCASTPAKSSANRAKGVTIYTQYVDPSSLCSSSSGFIQQSFNGDITGCFRVPSLHSASELVALQAYLEGLHPSSGPTTTFLPQPATGHLTLTLSSRTVKPGQTVTITGHYANSPPTQREGNANLCWGSCLGGLQEQGAPLHWTSHLTFHASLRVPDTAWLVQKGEGVSVHPLTSGTYHVGVQCLGVISGCALRAGDAHTSIYLKAPKPTRCVSGVHCETLHLSNSTAAVGDIVAIKGWAPLQTIIGQPFGYDLSITPTPKVHEFPAISYSRNSYGGGFNVVLTPRVLRLAPSPTWASLGTLTYQSSTWAGPSAIDADATAHLIAWCQPTGLEITGTGPTATIPTASVPAALVRTKLTIFSSSAKSPPCATVMLDPNRRQSIYAGFDTAMNDSAPPVYITGLYSTDGGSVWHTVPIPPGQSLEDFAGFSRDGNEIIAQFTPPSDYYSRDFPSGTVAGRVATEVTTNGGLSWTSSTLGCPSEGPCVTFGPFEWGNCAMNGSPQPLLVGPSNGGASDVKWHNSWVATVNSCFSQQLAVTSAHALLLLDPSSQYPLLRSTNSGTTWTYVAVPLVPGQSTSTNSAPLDAELLFSPSGSLMTILPDPSGLKPKLFLLKPRASSWCQVPHAFASNAPSLSVGPLRIDGDNLIWSQTDNPNAANPVWTMHVTPLSHLTC